MFRSYHLWRLHLHLAAGNAAMVQQVLLSDHDRFGFIDALILVAWLDGAKQAARR